MARTRFPKVSDTTHERRAHILAATAALIAREGLQGISVRAVADRAGCSRGLVEHYFRNKTELLLAANRSVNETYLERVAGAVGDLTGLAALEVRLRSLLPYTQTVLDEWRVRLVFWHQAGQEHTDPVLTKNNNESFYAAYNEILADVRYAQEHGEIPDTVPLIVTSELVLLLVMGIATACLGNAQLRQQRPLDRRVEMIIGLLKSGHVSALQVGDPETEY